MLITPHFVFVHLPKTGGTFIRKVIAEHLQVVARFDQHACASEIPPEYGGLPIFSVVRNPWDWYVSWYQHSLQYRPFADWDRFFAGNPTFSEAVQRACGIDLDDRFAKRLDTKFAGRMRRYDCDYYSLWWQRGFREEQLRGREVIVGRQENLVQDFIDMLDEVGEPSRTLREAATSDVPLNTTKRQRDYRSLYNDSLRELVAYKARQIIKTYDYTY